MGPFVYRERATKIDVNFAYGRVYFKEWTEQQFDATTTQLECGQSCAVDTKVTL